VREKAGVTNVWRGAEDDGDVYKPIWRWANAFQHDWAARADWCVLPYREANHPPVVVLNGERDVTASPGAKVSLDVSQSADPDGDALRTSWWQYREPGSYTGHVPISQADRAVASVQIPADAQDGDTIHLIGEVTDSGRPPLTRCSRVIVTVEENQDRGKD
jgi:hypothetical protein